jgi:hypothetical protein
LIDVVTMKFSIATIVAASCLSFSSAFSVQAPSSVGRSSVVLEASRNKQKIASRTKWLEARGMGDGAVVEVASEDLMTNDEASDNVDDEADEVDEAKEEATEEAKEEE